MSSTRIRAAAALAALALVPAACGDSGGSKPLSKQEYSKQAQRISKQFSTDVRSTQVKIKSAGDRKGRIAALAGFKKAFTDFAARIEKLKPPESLKADQDKLVAKARESAGDIDQVASAVKAKSKPKIKAAQKALGDDVEAVRAAAHELDAGSK